MYDELVTLARHCAEVDACINCPVGGCQGVTGIMNRLADAVEELSRAQEQWIEQERKMLLKSQPRWIPVTEGLPEEFQPVWVACKMKGRENWTFDTVYDPYLKCPWGSYYYLEKGEAVVYAWMDRSAPEPPKEET